MEENETHPLPSVVDCETLLACFVGLAIEVGTVTIFLAIIWIIFSPIWLYAFIVDLKDPVMENRGYISLLGIAALAAWAAELAPIPVAVLVILYAARTIQRNRVWHSHMTLSATAFEESPNNTRAALNYATALQATGASVLAAEHYKNLIVAGAPNGGQAAANLSSMRLLEGRVKETLEFLPHCIKTWPGVPDLHTNYGAAFAMEDRAEEAEFQFRLSLMLEPNAPNVLRNRAICLLALGHKEQALADIAKAEKLDGRTVVFQ